MREDAACSRKRRQAGLAPIDESGDEERVVREWRWWPRITGLDGAMKNQSVGLSSLSEDEFFQKIYSTNYTDGTSLNCCYECLG